MLEEIDDVEEQVETEALLERDRRHVVFLIAVGGGGERSAEFDCDEDLDFEEEDEADVEHEEDVSEDEEDPDDVEAQEDVRDIT